jgi:hypothetical protein
MWIFIWVLFSAFILGVFAWSTAILFQQKRAWQAFATKNGMTYVPGKFLGSPAVTGQRGGYGLSFFTDNQKTADVRGQRFVTVIEAQLKTPMPAPAALSTKEYGEFIGSLNLPDTYEPSMPEWNKSNVIRTRNLEGLKSYLTDERLKTLQSLFSMRNAIVLFFFDEHEAVLRIETADPLRDAVHMEKIARRIIDAMDKLKPGGIPVSQPA